jgi:hypothetical protein
MNYYALFNSYNPFDWMGNRFFCFLCRPANTYFVGGRYYCDIAARDQGRQSLLTPLHE